MADPGPGGSEAQVPEESAAPRRTWPRRLALTAGALAAAGALVAGASFALFTSQAVAQSDTFSAGTVILGSGSPSCTFANMEPGDSDNCAYTITYTGSLDAWITLSVNSMSTALATYQPAGSQTIVGGEALINDQSSNGLNVSITDNQGTGTTPESFSLGAVTCSNAGTAGTSLGQVGYKDSCTSSASGQLVAGQGSLSVQNCAANNSCLSVGGDGSVMTNWTDTFTVTGMLPLQAGNIYQGSTATVNLQASAVQASNNPFGLVPFQSDSSWQAATPGGTSLGNAEEVCLNATSPYASCPAGAVNLGYAGPSWTASLANIPNARWIWAPGVSGSTNVTTDPTVDFSKTFTLPADASSATITMYIAADNDATVYVNGTAVGNVGVVNDLNGANFDTITTINVPAGALHSGSNTIMVEGRNTLNGSSQDYSSNPAGVVFGGTINLP